MHVLIYWSGYRHKSDTYLYLLNNTYHILTNTPLSVEAAEAQTLRLFRKSKEIVEGNPLVKTSANCCADGT